MADIPPLRLIHLKAHMFACNQARVARCWRFLITDAAYIFSEVQNNYTVQVARHLPASHTPHGLMGN